MKTTNILRCIQTIAGRVLPLSLVTAVTVMLSGCTDTLADDAPGASQGTKVHGTLSLPLGVPTAGVVSRTVNFDPDATYKLDTYWVGVYDTKSGELIGTASATPRKSDGSRYTFNGSSNTYTVEDIDIYYYSNNPEAYIVGVVNYAGVKARKAGSGDALSDLSALLGEAKTWDDFCAISVDIQSVNRANNTEKSGYQETPLMTGFYMTGRSAAHPTVKGWDSNAVTQGVARVKLAEVDGGIMVPDGEVALMRLITDVNVEIYCPENVRVNSIYYKVMNNPTEVYLAEHATDTRGWNISSDKAVYDARSANSADYLGADGYTSDSYWRQLGDDMKFSYQQYENKHWGDNAWLFKKWPDAPYQFDPFSMMRETRMTGMPNLFQMLCLDKNHPWNNNAAYIMLKADIEVYEDGVKNSGVVEYTIHEGFTSYSDGSIVEYNDENRYDVMTCDFQRTRNTQYFYYISINGLRQLAVQVKAQPIDGQIHHDGISGEITRGEIKQSSGYSTGGSGGPVDQINKELFLHLFKNRKNLKWRYYDRTPDGEANYGNIDGTEAINWLPITTAINPNCPAEIMQEITFHVGRSPSGWFTDIMPPMTLEEFIALDDDALPQSDDNGWETQIRYGIKFGEYKAPADEAYSRYDLYKKAYYFYVEDRDFDGCTVVRNIIGYERSVLDDRGIVDGFYPLYRYRWWDDEQFRNIDYYVASENVLNYLTWFRSEYQDRKGGSWNWVYIDSYTLEINGHTFEIDADFVRDHNERNSTEGRQVVYFPYMPSDLGMRAGGVYKAKLTLNFDPDYVQPVEPIEMDIRVSEAKWDFINTPLVEFFVDEPDGYMMYSGLVANSGNGSTSSSLRTGGITFNGNGNKTFRFYKFETKKRGSVTVDLSNYAANAADRGVVVEVENASGSQTRTYIIPVENGTVRYKTTIDVSDLMIDGEVNKVYVYPTGKITMYGIEFDAK